MDFFLKNSDVNLDRLLIVILPELLKDFVAVSPCPACHMTSTRPTKADVESVCLSGQQIGNCFFQQTESFVDPCEYKHIASCLLNRATPYIVKIKS